MSRNSCSSTGNISVSGDSSTQPVCAVFTAPQLLTLVCLGTALPSQYVQYMLLFNHYHYCVWGQFYPASMCSTCCSLTATISVILERYIQTTCAELAAQNCYHLCVWGQFYPARICRNCCASTAKNSACRCSSTLPVCSVFAVPQPLILLCLRTDLHP
jgi:hypothetical protein